MLQRKVDMATALPADDAMADALIDQALAAVRDHMGMPIAYLSEFVDGRTIFRHVNAPGLEDVIKSGDSRPLDEVYCRHILDGTLPELIPDTSALPFARDLPITQLGPIGSHASLPVRRADGSIYGMFCTLSPDPNPDLSLRDLRVMRMFAGLATEQIRMRLDRRQDLVDATQRINMVLERRDFDVVYQPIYQLADGGLASFEALCRFRPQPYRSPDKWFAEARIANLDQRLELAVIDTALTAFPELPSRICLAVNASPDTLASGALRPVLDKIDARRVTVEVTEHDKVADMASLQLALDDLRALGTRIAVDDVGTGYAGLQQILRLRPDILKLDMTLVQQVDTDPARKALATALVQFARDTGAQVVAEGIERLEEWSLMRELGVDYGQGWLTGRPGAIGDAAPMARTG